MKNNKTRKRYNTRDKVYSEDEVRQGEIILHETWQRVVFFAGLIGFLVFVIVLAVATT